MKSLLLTAVLALAAGIGGALGYSFYLGDGKQVRDLQTELASAQASAAKAVQDSHDATSETASMSAQIQQLTASKQQLAHQVDELKTAAAPPEATPEAPKPDSMKAIVQAQMQRMAQTQLLLVKTRLHLTPEQEAAVQAAMDAEGKRTEAMTDKLLSGGKVDMQALTAEAKSVKSVDQTLNDILTPDQKTAYQQMKSDQKTSAAETIATSEVGQVTPLLQLSDAQKDQAYNALYQVQMNAQDPAWIKANVSASTDPSAILDAQAKAKEDALSKILTPDQLAAYHQQAQSQLALQKSMMQRFMPAVHGGAAPAAAGP